MTSEERKEVRYQRRKQNALILKIANENSMMILIRCSPTTIYTSHTVCVVKMFVGSRVRKDI